MARDLRSQAEVSGLQARTRLGIWSRIRQRMSERSLRVATPLVKLGCPQREMRISGSREFSCFQHLRRDENTAWQTSPSARRITLNLHISRQQCDLPNMIDSLDSSDAKAMSGTWGECCSAMPLSSPAFFPLEAIRSDRTSADKSMYSSSRGRTKKVEMCWNLEV